jgi:hypothetical protein
MSNNRSCAAMLFALSLLAGTILAFLIVSEIRAGQAATEVPPTSLASTPGPGEGSILVVGVDRLDGSALPLLEGAWLVSLCCGRDQPQETLHLNIITVYPVVSQSVTASQLSELVQPHTPIMIDTNNLGALRLQMPFSYADEAWTDVLVVDEVVVNMLVSLQNPNMPRPIPTPGPDLFIKPWQMPEKAYQQQQAILITLCDHPRLLADLQVVLDVLAMYDQHLVSTLTAKELLTLWQLVDFAPDRPVLCSRFP